MRRERNRRFAAAKGPHLLKALKADLDDWVDEKTHKFAKDVALILRQFRAF